MQSKRDGLVPIADIFTDWDGPKPQTVRPFTQADQVNQLMRFFGTRKLPSVSSLCFGLRVAFMG